MPQKTKTRTVISASAVKCWVWMLVLLLLLSLGCVLASFLTNNLIKVKFKVESSIGQPSTVATHTSTYGIWKSCSKIHNQDYVCRNTKGYGAPFDAVYSREILILYLISICLYLPSIIGLILVAVHVKSILLAVLSFFTMFASFGTIVAALVIFTLKVEFDLKGDTRLGNWQLTEPVTVTYWWSYFLAWIGTGVMFIVLLNTLAMLCCQRRIANDEEAEAKTQVREPTENGVYNPSYKPGHSMKAKYPPSYPVIFGDQAQQVMEQNASTASPASSYRDSPREIRLKEEMFYRPNPSSTDMFKQQQTIELRPRMVHQPTPFMDDMPPDYPVDEDSEDRTYTVSQVVPASGVETGLKLEVGDTYLVSLNQ